MVGRAKSRCAASRGAGRSSLGPRTLRAETGAGRRAQRAVDALGLVNVERDPLVFSLAPAIDRSPRLSNAAPTLAASSV